jgi:hypothetical protein
MKKFIIMVLSVSVFFVGLGGLVDKAGAKFKSDERALAVIAQARQAIGGDAAIKNVRSMTIVGNAAQTFTVDGASRIEEGNLEINLQMPNGFNRMLQFDKVPDGTKGSEIHRESQVILTTKDDDHTMFKHSEADGKTKVFVMKKGGEDKLMLKEGELPNETRVELDKVHRNVPGDASRLRHNELFRTTFALLLSAPEGSDASYNHAGVENVDGKSCDVILVDASGSAFKLFIDQSSHLPVMLSYKGAIPMVFKFNRDEIKAGGDGRTKNVIINRDGSHREIKDDKMQIIIRKLDAPETLAEYQVRFSDYRNTGGVQLPYKWTQTVGGQPDQTVSVVSYEINPANIEDKFKQTRQPMLLRTKKPQ